MDRLAATGLLRKESGEGDSTLVRVGESYLGTVVRTTNFGAFVSLFPGVEGLLHISMLRALTGGRRVENVEDVVSVGQRIPVKIAEIDDRGKLWLEPFVQDDAAEADVVDYEAWEQGPEPST